MQPQATPQQTYADVLELLQTYYDGLYHTDVSKLVKLLVDKYMN